MCPQIKLCAEFQKVVVEVSYHPGQRIGGSDVEAGLTTDDVLERQRDRRDP
jgi:hypothetical protein